MPGMAKASLTTLKPDVIQLVRAVPRGHVTTYGAIAACLFVNPRHVARILANLTPEESASLPWHRVVAAGGKISSFKRQGVGRRQVEKLGKEGIAVSPAGRIEAFEERFHLPMARPTRRVRPRSAAR